ncbi:hypothetical protein TRIP_B220110 [uncultured Desulfatiglans sp.]|uniref:Uncharacterized protein n=1 Tax=Uncultured Desulfatiglans sp. TaxID=1748965 RepID=A0A653A5B5_UNCDX|nr:hypothetical protein TRIP_B220110 [uncultured Desulfatiglans sp.]
MQALYLGIFPQLVKSGFFKTLLMAVDLYGLQAHDLSL